MGDAIATKLAQRMRLNAYLARAGVASRRKADELIKAGRVRVNGAPGELNTFVASGDRVEVDGRPVAKQQPRLRAAAQAGRRRHDRARSAAAARPSSSSSRRRPRRPGRPARRRHHRRAPAHERRRARAPARAPALRGRQGLRGRGRGRAVRRRAAGALPRASSSTTAAPRPPGSAGSARRGSSSPCTRAASTRCKRMCEAVGHPVAALHRRGYAGLDARRASSRASGASSTTRRRCERVCERPAAWLLVPDERRRG